jgi:hypothetical protein
MEVPGRISTRKTYNNRLLQVPSEFASKVASGAADAVSGAADAVSGAANTLSDVASGAVSGVTSGAEKLVSGVSSGLTSGIAAASAATLTAANEPSFISYLIMFLLLSFLFFNVYVLLMKPANKGIGEYYEELIAGFTLDKVTNWFRNNVLQMAAPAQAQAPAHETPSALSAIEKSVENTVESTLENTITNKIKNEPTVKKEKKKKFDYKPDENTSRVQQNKAKSGSGFCYIGEDRGFRSCIDVAEGDVCMSGDIFPSRDICINPRLRE